MQDFCNQFYRLQVQMQVLRQSPNAAFRFVFTGARKPRCIESRGDVLIDIAALPLFVPERGDASFMPMPFADGERDFRSDGEGSAHDKAFQYIVRLAVLDLQCRGFRDERISCFQ